MSVLPFNTGDELLACVPRLRRYARALVGERAAADDLVQDTVERGWARLASLRPGTDMRAWLFSIMHNVRIDQVRRGALSTEPLDDATPMPAMAERTTIGLELRDMDAALRLLSEEQRAILLMIALEEMRYEEVAQALGIPIGTVMSRLARAREKLRILMEGGASVTPLKVVK
ncbi:RNA polymerase sigma factor [Duganella aceris]|uniref:RNA polymerase sigma factor n=1 Tax=Duganella aceris TaxID=2703883 RepID=A0ABX0FGV5_9BURK|nr:RNA polymerase sigma factor [Duganella aceris]NGZ83745.1 RNA polymerase sigma factor [Duganella aceris]